MSFIVQGENLYENHRGPALSGVKKICPTRQLEFGFATDPREKFEVLRVETGSGVFIELRRKRS
jgi:hypothetical protein